MTTVHDVYLLVLHEPYVSGAHPVPINATIVHALTLLHPVVPQPDGGLVYRCLTEFPGRAPGGLVPLSTLTFELDGGRLWSQIGDWEAVVKAVARLVRDQHCDGLVMGLPVQEVALLAGGPTTVLTVTVPGQENRVLGGLERQQQVERLSEQLRTVVADRPFWPGDDLVAPPTDPPTMPYHPYDPPR